MRNLTRREFWLLLVFPGLLILGIYYFGCERPVLWPALVRQEQSSAALKRSIAELDRKIEATPPTPASAVIDARKELSLLRSAAETEKHWAQLNAHPWEMAPVRWTSAAGRIEALRTLTAACQASGLMMISRQNEKSAKEKVPKELEDFAAAVNRDGNHPIPQIWRIEAVGSYRQALAALTGVGQDDAFIVPLAVAMDDIPGEPVRRRWTIWFWL